MDLKAFVGNYKRSLNDIQKIAQYNTHNFQKHLSDDVIEKHWGRGTRSQEQRRIQFTKFNISSSNRYVLESENKVHVATAETLPSYQVGGKLVAVSCDFRER